MTNLLAVRTKLLARRADRKKEGWGQLSILQNRLLQLESNNLISLSKLLGKTMHKSITIGERYDALL